MSAETNPVLAEFMEKTRQEIEEAKRKKLDEEKAQLMLDLGLTKQEKEYAPDTMTDWRVRTCAGYVQSEEISGEKKYYRIADLPIPISDEEFADLKKLLDEKHTILSPTQTENADEKPSDSPIIPQAPCYQIVPIVGNKSSTAANFMKVLAVLVWIGGLIIAILSSNIQVTGRNGDVTKEFQFSLFFPVAFEYGLYGALILCMAEVIENIGLIANYLRGMTAKPQE